MVGSRLIIVKELITNNGPWFGQIAVEHQIISAEDEIMKLTLFVAYLDGQTSSTIIDAMVRKCPKWVENSPHRSLHVELDELQKILKCQKVIAKRDMNYGLNDILERARDSTGEKVVNLYRLIVNKCRKNFDPKNTIRWVAVLEDLLQLQKDIFNLVSPTETVSVFVDQLLCFAAVPDFLELASNFVCSTELLEAQFKLKISIFDQNFGHDFYF